jgi:hypothetical protein
VLISLWENDDGLTMTALRHARAWWPVVRGALGAAGATLPVCGELTVSSWKLTRRHASHCRRAGEATGRRVRRRA